MDLMKLLLTTLTVVLGFLISYLKTKSKLKDLVLRYIVQAEDSFKDMKAGSKKFEYVVSRIYNLIPVFLKPIFTKDVIGKIVQNSFDYMQNYARQQLDKAIDTKIKALDK